MPKQGQNKPDDFNYTREKLNEAIGERAKNHVYRDGEYVAVDYVHQEFPKVKYHADFVYQKNEGILYSFTESSQLVNNRQEEQELGDGWKDSPAAFGIVTQPDEKAVAMQRLADAKKGGSWRKGANIPDESVTENHLEFARSNGVPNLSSMGDLYKFLATLTAAQMRDFMKEANDFGKEPEKRGPGRPKKEVVAV